MIKRVICGTCLTALITLPTGAVTTSQEQVQGEKSSATLNHDEDCGGTSFYTVGANQATNKALILLKKLYKGRSASNSHSCPEPLRILKFRAHSVQVTLSFPPTDNVGAPERTGGGGTCDLTKSCVQGNTPLTVLAPANNLGTTLSANPTLFWYVPQTTAKFAQLLIDDEQGNEDYRYRLKLSLICGM